jgi:hypothetical protein
MGRNGKGILMTANAGDLDPVVLTMELVSIPSVNPDLVPGAPGEAEIAARGVENAHNMPIPAIGTCRPAIEWVQWEPTCSDLG